jgi:hypothetical protein
MKKKEKEVIYKPKFKICVSGAAETGPCSEDAHLKAYKVGAEIVNQGAVLVTGATTGIPYWAAKGAKEAGGISIGLSPAPSEIAHVKTYKLPTDYFDLIIYTGFEYSGRNLLLTRSADGVAFICGRMGTLNEFTIAFEDRKPMAVLEDTGGFSNKFRQLVKDAQRGSGKIAYSKDPAELVASLIKIMEQEKK